jgi:hypothetical protein
MAPSSPAADSHLQNTRLADRTFDDLLRFVTTSMQATGHWAGSGTLYILIYYVLTLYTTVRYLLYILYILYLLYILYIYFTVRYASVPQWYVNIVNFPIGRYPAHGSNLEIFKNFTADAVGTWPCCPCPPPSCWKRLWRI